MKEISVREFCNADAATQLDVWYDWFCSDKSLVGRTARIVPKLKKIVDSPKINHNTMYVWLKNNCPCYGDNKVYDDIRISDKVTGTNMFVIVPRDPYGKACVYTPGNGYENPAVRGTFKDVVKYFMGEQK